MKNKDKEFERQDTEEFVKEVLQRVPKGSARKRVLELTGLAAAMAIAQTQATGNMPNTT